MGSLPVNKQVNVIVVDPRDPKIVFAAGPAGMFRSSDSGLTWQASGQGLSSAAIVALALNPNQPDLFYAATADGSLFVSEDGAQSWKLVTSK